MARDGQGGALQMAGHRGGVQTIDEKLAQFGFSINKERRECSAPPEVAAGNPQSVFREILMPLAVTSPERPRISRCAPSRVARSSLGEKTDVCENNNCVACPCKRHIERSSHAFPPGAG